jgi:2'-5' RNA ligase
MTYPERFSDHWWWRPGVRPGARLLVWHVLFDDQPHLRAFVGEYLARLAGLGALDLVPAEWLHMTVHIAAVEDDLTAAAIETMATAVAQRVRKLQPIETTLGKPILHTEGIVVVADPAHEVTALHSEVAAGVAETLGGGHASNEADFIPHVSLAYANTSAPSGPAIRALRPALRPCTFRIAEVRLVAQQRCGHQYRWEPITAAPLDTPGPIERSPR